MSKRVDHVADAMACLVAADNHLGVEMVTEIGEYKADVIATAQVHATLALYTHKLSDDTLHTNVEIKEALGL